MSGIVINLLFAALNLGITFSGSAHWPVATGLVGAANLFIAGMLVGARYS